MLVDSNLLLSPSFFPLSLHNTTGRRCFEDFLFDEVLGADHTAAKFLMMFLNEVKELYSEQPDAAFQKVKDMQEKYFFNKTLQAIPGLWKNQVCNRKKDRSLPIHV